MIKKVLVTSAKPFEIDAFNKHLNKEIYKEKTISWHFNSKAINSENLKLGFGYDILCLFVSDHLKEEDLKILKSNGTKFIALRSAGFNHVDIHAATKIGIPVVRVPKYSPRAVAEFSVGLYLSLNRKIHRAHSRVKENNFSLEGLVGHDVYKQTIGVIGCGAIGKAVAEIFRGFGSKVLAFDPQQDLEWANKNRIQYTTLEQLLSCSNVVTLHAPLNESTHHIIDEKALEIMNQDSYLINTSRGGLVDTRALIHSLKMKKLAGAALDVYEEEENLFFYNHSEDIIGDDNFVILNSMPNVLITSHQAFLTVEAIQQIAETTIENIYGWSDNKPLSNLIKI